MMRNSGGNFQHTGLTFYDLCLQRELIPRSAVRHKAVDLRINRQPVVAIGSCIWREVVLIRAQPSMEEKVKAMTKTRKVGQSNNYVVTSYA